MGTRVCVLTPVQNINLCFMDRLVFVPAECELGRNQNYGPSWEQEFYCSSKTTGPPGSRHFIAVTKLRALLGAGILLQLQNYGPSWEQEFYCSYKTTGPLESRNFIAVTKLRALLRAGILLQLQNYGPSFEQEFYCSDKTTGPPATFDELHMQ